MMEGEDPPTHHPASARSALTFKPRLLGFLLGLFGFSAPLHAAASEPTAAALREWHGEYFDKKSGGLFVTAHLKGFARGNTITSNVQVYLYDLLKRQSFVVSVPPNGLNWRGKGLTIYLARSGKYKVKQVVMVDGEGVKRTWQGAAPPLISVKRQCLSNLGDWILAPVGKAGLSVTMTPMGNPYKESTPKSASAVAAVLDGFSGLIQETLGGKRVLLGAEDNYGSKSELRKSITFTRQISMFFKLDLNRRNQYAKAIGDVLTAYDANMRKCYTDRLDFNDELRGDVRFTFLLAKATGTMARLKSSGGSLGDPKLAECLYFELSHIQFPTPENLVGELIYIYDVK